jgi:hypothetical protein
MHIQWRHWFLCISTLLLLLLTACNAAGTGSQAHATPTANNQTTSTTNAGAQINTLSTVSFITTGDVSGTYRIHTATLTSKLRHGHKEFTIFMQDSGKALTIAFYGYQGPGTYTLAGLINGGDVRIDLGHDDAWDLAMKPNIACTLTITSQTPTQLVGVDHMTGDFACPQLHSAYATAPQKSISVNHGTFDLLIIVES